MRTFYYLGAREGKSRKGERKRIREEQGKAHPRLAGEAVHERHTEVKALGRRSKKASAFDLRGSHKTLSQRQLLSHSLQLGVLRLRFLQDVDVELGVCPECEEVLICWCGLWSCHVGERKGRVPGAKEGLTFYGSLRVCICEFAS
jgi:hypothetical protein